MISKRLQNVVCCCTLDDEPVAGDASEGEVTGHRHCKAERSGSQTKEVRKKRCQVYKRIGSRQH